MTERTVHFERRMNETDLLMWTIESDPLLRSTITSVAVLDAPLDHGRLAERIERATRQVPRLRQCVRPVPFDLAPPEYVTDAQFDLSYHLRFQRAPGAGTLRDVLDYAQPFAMAGFDRARPLWEMVVLDDVEGGRSAFVMKMHHSLADGIGAMRISMAFVDTERDPESEHRPLPGLPPAGGGSVASEVGAALAYRAGQAVHAAVGLPATVASVVRRPVAAAGRVVSSAASTARMLRPVSSPLSPVMTGRSLSVHFDVLTASLPAMKAAARRVDGRLNDAFVAAVAGGFDRYHRSHGAPVDQLRMTLPVNVRPAHGAAAGGNQFVPCRFAFPVSGEDPLERMAVLRDLVRRQRAEPALHLAGPIAGILNRLPGPVTTAVFGSMLKAIDVVTSNVPGPPLPIYVAGGRLEAHFPFAPLAGAACNITLLSYVDDLHIGVTTDRAAVPDPEHLRACLADGLAEVEKLAAD